MLLITRAPMFLKYDGEYLHTIYDNSGIYLSFFLEEKLTSQYKSFGKPNEIFTYFLKFYVRLNSVT